MKKFRSHLCVWSFHIGWKMVASEMWYFQQYYRTLNIRYLRVVLQCSIWITHVKYFLSVCLIICNISFNLFVYQEVKKTFISPWNINLLSHGILIYLIVFCSTLLSLASAICIMAKSCGMAVIKYVIRI